ncbi:uncharacterized protein C19orf44 homolog isoform X2 [Thunnus maccoyii]|uniref:uncharacterized protein C19orf44 homolog isoform X2 n=1 Tax=Thunnus maccoyii TaxID=8240 RepID=UPI001C4CEFB8|nr:uncharacterized protein C19orf44 homolog isoform X2 [Thunnus maccoyii]
MWRRGGRSSALDRAQALLSGKRTSGGDGESTQGPTAKTPTHTGAVGGYIKPRSAPSNAHTLLSDLSDLSSVSSASEHGVGVVGSADAEYHQRREGDPTKDPRPQSSLGGGGSRFLKKAPPPAINSSQSPIHKSQMQQVPEHRYVSSSQRGSQTAALRRLAQIESRIRSRKQAQEHEREGLKPAHNLTSDMGISPPPVVSQSLEAPVFLSVQSSSEESQKGKRFLKSKAAVAVDGSDTVAAAAGSPKGPDVGVRSRSRAADVSVPLVDLESKSVRIVSSVSLESDEEDMRKLLGNSLDSTDNSLLRPERPSSRRTGDKMLSRSSKRVHSTPPPAAVRPSSSSNTAPPRSPASPHRHSSPFRFTGQAQARFSPSVLSPSPPPSGPPSPRRAESPQRSLSSMSGHGEVLSLEELFPVEPEDPHSEMSLASSEDFKINVMTLDDLVPASLGFPEETPAKEGKTKHIVPAAGSPNRHQQLPGLKEVGEEQQHQEDEVDYRSDFESESRTEPDYSASQVSEHLLGDGEQEEVVSEVREEAFESDVSHRRTEDDYSSTFSDTSRSCTSRTSDRSQRSLSRSRDSRSSRSSVSHSDWDSSRPSRKHASARKVLKETAVQTQPDPLAYTWSSGMATFGSAVGMTYMNPTPVTTHAINSETVEALSTFNPAAYALNEILKQHLAMTRRFIESSRHLHSSQLRNLEPPNYRYITLDDTKEYIRKRTPPKLTMEEALEEVLQEMKDYHSM